MRESPHSIGDLKILPFLGRGGGFVVFNTKAPNNEGVLGWYAKVEQADEAMRAEWAERKKAA